MLINKKKKFWNQFNIQWVLLAVFLVILIVLFLYLEQANDEGRYPIAQVAILWLLLLIFFLWLGNLIIFKTLRKRYLTRFLKDYRFVVQLTLTLLFSLFYINFSYFFFKARYTSLPPNNDQLLLLNIYGILFLIPVLSIQFGILFLQKWKRVNLEGERLKKEQVQSELITLKSHLSPHFLFNNLNILSSLIEGENHIAQEFLDRFSDVYRYVLKNKDAELITLMEELEFMEGYVFLLKQRFSNELKVEIEVPEACLQLLIPPLALQMLFENALKHNKMSEDNPLIVKISTNGHSSVFVKNNLDLRRVLESNKNGLGLDNIRRRYKLIANKDIVVKKDSKKFIVTLPLIPPL